MSKTVKAMQMTALKKDFGGVRDYVMLSVQGVDAQVDNRLRLDLRKKNIRLQMVKNAIVRRVLAEEGITVDDKHWSGPTVLAWGGDSIKGLSKEIDDHLKAIVKKNDKLKDKIKIKTAIADGQAVAFEAALKMPTRTEAIGEIVGMILGPGSAIANLLTAPASQIASQIEQIGEKKDDSPADAPAA